MKLDLLGHACVALESSSGEVLLIDPYESGQFGGRMAYQPIDVEPDWVVTSHAHADHSAVQAVPGVFELVEQGRVGPFEVRRHAAFHDEFEGRRRGGAVDVIEVAVDGLRIAHLSDVGQSPITSIVRELRGVDVLLIPIGGFYTIGAAQAWEWIARISPGCAIPMHQRTPACSLPIRDATAFAAWQSESIAWKTSPIVVQGRLPTTLFLAHRMAERVSAENHA